MTKTSLPTHPLGEAANVISGVDQELAGCRFRDNRLGQRLRKLLTHMAGAIGGSLPLACQDWANTKAAYRFLSNPKVSDDEILQGHFQATRTRFAAFGGPILVIQDTTELSYERAQPERIGATRRVNSGREKEGRYRMHTVWAAHALLPGCDRGWAAAGAFGDQVLDEASVQGRPDAQTQI